MTEQIEGKYKIVTESRIVREKQVFYCTVYNTNAKKLYNSIVHNYYFSTQERMTQWVNSFIDSVRAHEARKIARREERKNAPRNTQITSILKQALAKKYGYQNVRVWRGTGTAYGWVHASIQLQKKQASCEMDIVQPWGQVEKCYKCQESWRNDQRQAEELSYKAVKDANLSFGHCYSDDGYGTQRSEFLLDVHYQK